MRIIWTNDYLVFASDQLIAPCGMMLKTIVSIVISIETACCFTVDSRFVNYGLTCDLINLNIETAILGLTIRRKYQVLSLFLVECE